MAACTQRGNVHNNSYNVHNLISQPNQFKFSPNLEHKVLLGFQAQNIANVMVVCTYGCTQRGYVHTTFYNVHNHIFQLGVCAHQHLWKGWKTNLDLSGQTNWQLPILYKDDWWLHRHLDMCISTTLPSFAFLASLEVFPRTLFLSWVTWRILIVPDWRLGGLGHLWHYW